MAILDRVENPAEGDRFPVDAFISVAWQVHDGEITQAAAGTVLEGAPFNCDTAEVNELDSWFDQMNGQANATLKLAYVDKTRALMAALEAHVPGFSAASVKTWLGF